MSESQATDDIEWIFEGLEPIDPTLNLDFDDLLNDPNHDPLKNDFNYVPHSGDSTLDSGVSDSMDEFIASHSTQTITENALTNDFATAESNPFSIEAAASIAYNASSEINHDATAEKNGIMGVIDALNMGRQAGSPHTAANASPGIMNVVDVLTGGSAVPDTNSGFAAPAPWVETATPQTSLLLADGSTIIVEDVNPHERLFERLNSAMATPGANFLDFYAEDPYRAAFYALYDAFEFSVPGTNASEIQHFLRARRKVQEKVMVGKPPVEKIVREYWARPQSYWSIVLNNASEFSDWDFDDMNSIYPTEGMVIMAFIHLTKVTNARRQLVLISQKENSSSYEMFRPLAKDTQLTDNDQCVYLVRRNNDNHSVWAPFAVQQNRSLASWLQFVDSTKTDPADQWKSYTTSDGKVKYKRPESFLPGKLYINWLAGQTDFLPPSVESLPKKRKYTAEQMRAFPMNTIKTAMRTKDMSYLLGISTDSTLRKRVEWGDKKMHAVGLGARVSKQRATAGIKRLSEQKKLAKKKLVKKTKYGRF